MGWIGPTSQLLHALDVAGADRDDEGNFLITTHPVITGIGGEEAVVHDRCTYLRRGQPLSLAGLMNSTSYGTAVTVI